MAVIIVNHPVKDYKTWKPLYDADVKRRSGVGLKELAVGQRADNPHMAYMVWEAKDPAAVHTMMKDPSLKAVMKEAGVTGDPEVVVID